MEYKDINDYELIYMIYDNDEEYINLLIEKYKPLIDNKIRKWYWIFDDVSFDENDLRQEINILLIGALRKFNFDSDTSFYTYFNIYIERYFVDRVRKKNKVNNISICSLDSFVDYDNGLVIKDLISFDDNSLIGDSNSYEYENFIKGFCYDLSINYASVLELSICGYKVSEISCLLDMPCKSVSNILYNIREKLREKY